MNQAPASRPLYRLVSFVAEQWLALAFGAISCFLILLATKRFGPEVRVFCALGAIAVIALWLATGDFRRDGIACAASSTLALTPIAALECGWIAIDDPATALLIETFCLAILFASQVERLGGEAITAARLALRRLPLLRVPEADSSRGLVIRCCMLLLALLVGPAAVTAATLAVVPASFFIGG